MVHRPKLMPKLKVAPSYVGVWLLSAGPVSDQMDDSDLEFLPAYHAPELAKAHGQEHRDGVSWTLLGGTEFDELLEATKTNKTAAHVRSVFLRGYPDIVEKQRVGMSSDGEVLSGCHWNGCGSLGTSARCREAVDSDSEAGLVLQELNFEYENSLAAEITSNSHCIWTSRVVRSFSNCGERTLQYAMSTHL